MGIKGKFLNFLQDVLKSVQLSYLNSSCGSCGVDRGAVRQASDFKR